MAEWQTERFGLVTAPACFLYDEPGTEDGTPAGTQSDEFLSGWAVALSSGENCRGWLRVRAFYGYTGWLWAGHLRQITREELAERADRERFVQVAMPQLDLHTGETVQSGIAATLPRAAVVEKLGPGEQEGWLRIRGAGGEEGFVRTGAVKPRKFDEAFLLSSPEDLTWFRRQPLPDREEAELRHAVAETAMSWLGTQYRWGGKTAQGIDCSGLAFMSWLENGVMIYRDAKILPEYPLREIPREQMAEGDLIFYPGHVMVCLGNRKYVHATAYAATPCVTVNSLRPGDPDYREDLDRGITACGTVFG